MAANDRYKQPICEATAETLFAILDDIKEYIGQIQIKSESSDSTFQVITSSVSALNVMTSLKGIYHDFI